MSTTRTELGAAQRVLACASHDLNGTLQALFTYLRLIEQRTPSSQLSAALLAAQRLRDEVASLRAVAGPASRATVDLRALLAELRGVDPARLAIAADHADVLVEGEPAGLALALAGLVRAVAAAASDAEIVPITLDPRAGEVRVRIGAPGDFEPFDPLVGQARERVGLDVLLAAMALESHGGQLLRSGAPGAWAYLAVIPRSRP